MNTKVVKKDIAFIEALISSLSDKEEKSADLIKANLKADGVDVDSILKRLNRTVAESSARARKNLLNIAREKRLAEEAMRKPQKIDFSEWGKDRIIKEIENLRAVMGVSVAFSYRELEESNVDDLKSILEDIIAICEDNG